MEQESAMKLIFTVEYECEKVLATTLPESDKYHAWVEVIGEEPMSVYGSTDYLRSLHPRRMVYGLSFIKDDVRVEK